MSETWPLPPLSPGEFAPDFALATRFNPKFHFNTVAGRYVLLGFAPAGREDEAAAALSRIRPLLDDRNLAAFLVSGRGGFDGVPPDTMPGLRWFLDPDGAVAALYGPAAGWFLMDPSLRLIASAPFGEAPAILQAITGLPPAPLHAGPSLVAPVLVVPRVYDPDFCKALMAYYDAQGGLPSGVMRDIDGKTVGVLDPMKSRRDVHITDPGLKAGVIRGLEKNLSPMIERAFHFKATRLERYLVACYDAAEGGFFRPHRDNQTYGTAHRKFAVSVNLNAEDFEGGDLRFPEFGPRTYRPPTGGAVVFNCSLLHEATPVTRGRRYALLPFLYDAAGEAVRQRNQDKLGEQSVPAAQAQ